MAGYALLIGTKGSKRELVADGDPRDIRSLFKTSKGDGFDLLEVIETSVGRSRKRKFAKKPAAKKAAKSSQG